MKFHISQHLLRQSLEQFAQEPFHYFQTELRNVHNLQLVVPKSLILIKKFYRLDQMSSQLFGKMYKYFQAEIHQSWLN